MNFTLYEAAPHSEHTQVVENLRISSVERWLAGPFVYVDDWIKAYFQGLQTRLEALGPLRLRREIAEAKLAALKAETELADYEDALQASRGNGEDEAFRDRVVQALTEVETEEVHD